MFRQTFFPPETPGPVHDLELDDIQPDLLPPEIPEPVQSAGASDLERDDVQPDLLPQEIPRQTAGDPKLETDLDGLEFLTTRSPSTESTLRVCFFAQHIQADQFYSYWLLRLPIIVGTPARHL
jgi:hypothetical protein